MTYAKSCRVNVVSSGLVGSVWLAVHLDRQLSAEEVVLRARFGAGWVAYAAEVPRWPGVYAGGCLLLACACCGWICERLGIVGGRESS